tara:strand:- start:183 stop:530 length:348 start_codon:yes stop_codon:yes gene_type:complete
MSHLAIKKDSILRRPSPVLDIESIARLGQDGLDSIGRSAAVRSVAGCMLFGSVLRQSVERRLEHIHALQRPAMHFDEATADYGERNDERATVDGFDIYLVEEEHAKQHTDDYKNP